MTNDGILRSVSQYYSDRIKQYGATAKGVDWRDEDSQELRFEQFNHLWAGERDFSLNDIGCGYGALFDYLTKDGLRVEYCGVDLSPEMLATARSLHEGQSLVSWHQGAEAPARLDYTVASGILNVKGETPAEEWRPYVFENIDAMAASCTRGFAFNVLSMHSDPPKRQPHLFYADPGEVIDYVGTKISRHLMLTQNYGLYEFTVIVRL
jgi:SAM-dependent methyltransferase